MLDDAVYDGDAAATTGTLSYASPVLTWTGNLAPGATATVTFSVTVNNPDTGDKLVIITATSAAPGSACPTGTTAAPCRSTVAVLTPALTIAATAGSTTAMPGATVHYTVTITDTGQTPYTGITVTDSLSGLLDDAAYNGDAAASTRVGLLRQPEPDLDREPGPRRRRHGHLLGHREQPRHRQPGPGHPAHLGRGRATTARPAAPTRPAPPACRWRSAALLTFAVSSDVSSAVAGGVVHYTVTVTNAAATPYAGATFTDDLTGVLDDAAYNGDATASTGTVLFTSPDLTWTGTVPATGTATITFSVTVNNPDTGNKILSSTLTSTSAGSNCPVGGTDPACSSTVTVSSLAITNTANVTSTTPGGVVRFTATFTNTGQTPYNGITISTNAVDVFDDAVPDGDQTATSGTLTIVGNGVTWTGNIPVGGTVTVTGTVTVNNPDTGNHVAGQHHHHRRRGQQLPRRRARRRVQRQRPRAHPRADHHQHRHHHHRRSPAPSSATPSPSPTPARPPTPASASPTSFAQMLDDAAYDGDAAATAGTLSYASPVLTWTGDPGRRRHRHGHLHGHGEQPRHRRQDWSSSPPPRPRPDRPARPAPPPRPAAPPSPC